jgi:hypothetical protein
VVDVRERPELTLDCLHERGVTRGERLERDSLVALSIERRINDPHAAATEDPLDGETTVSRLVARSQLSVRARGPQ